MAALHHCLSASFCPVPVFPQEAGHSLASQARIFSNAAPAVGYFASHAEMQLALEQLFTHAENEVRSGAAPKARSSLQQFFFSHSVHGKSSELTGHTAAEPPLPPPPPLEPPEPPLLEPPTL